MADSILRLQVESQEYDAKLKRATEGLQRYVDGCRKVGGTLEVVEKDTLDYVKSLGQMETVSRSATGKLAEMKKAFTELSMQYKQMTDAERQSPMGKALSQSLDQLNGRIAETKKQMDDVSRDMNGGGGLGGALDALAGKFGLNINQLAGWGAALAAAKTALDTAKDAFFASEETVDEWGRTMASAGSLYEGFLNAINTGDISGYLDRIDQISTAAKAAYNEMDRLGTMKTIQAPQMVRQETENQRMRTMLMTGRYIAPADGRPAANGMKTGDLLSPAQIKNIERHLQNGMQTIVGLTKNELNQTGRTIDAYYNKLAKQNGISLNEFREGTASMEAYEYRLSMAQEYRKFESAHTTLRRVYNPQIADYETKPYRDNVVNPHAKYRGWEVFRVDKMGENSYNDLVGLIRQQQQQTGQLYSTIGQSYRTINRVEGVTPNKLLHGGSGSGSSKTTTLTEKELTIQQQISKLETEAYTATEERRKEIAKLIQQLDKELEKQKAIRDELHGIGQSTAEIVQGTNIQTAAGMGSYLSILKEQQGKAQYGSAEYNALNAQIVDVNTLNNLMKESVIAGVDSGIFEAADELGRDFWTRAMEGGVENIDWQSIVDKINEKRKEAGLDAIKLDFQTGNIKELHTASSLLGKDFNEAAAGIGKVGTALQQIEDPSAKVMGIIAEAIANIALTFSKSLAGTFTPWEWIAAAIAGTATMVSTIAAIKSTAHFAEGGIVGGNDYTDNTPIMVSSGELILNKAQQDNLAAVLSSQDETLMPHSSLPYVSGEKIVMGINNYGKRTGRGELVFSK